MKINETLVKIDVALDYVPGFSALSNLVDIFQKTVILPFSSEPVEKNRYYKHLNEKSFSKCLLFMIPFAALIFKIFFSSKPIVSENEQDLPNKTQQPLPRSETISSPGTLNKRAEIIVEKDPKEAEKLWKASVEKNNDLDAIKNLAFLSKCTRNAKDEFLYTEQAAKLGDAESMANLALLYLKNETDKDKRTGYEWMEKAKAQANEYAKDYLDLNPNPYKS